MSNVNITRSGPEVFQDNDRHDDLDFTTGLREFKPITPRRDWRQIGILFAGVAGLTFVLFVLYHVWKLIYCWTPLHYTMCQRIDITEPVVVGAVLCITLVTIVWSFVVKHSAIVRQQRAIANRINLTLDRFGDQVPADLFDRIQPQHLLTYLEGRYTQATDLQAAIARWQLYKGVNTLSEGTFHYHIENEISNGNPDNVIDVSSITPMLPNDWIAWFNTRPHGMLAAATGEGKSTTAKAILIPRIRAGEDLFIIDPHSSDWFGIVGRGAGDNWADVCQAIMEVYQLYNYRMQEREKYLRETGKELSHDYFPRLNVLVDEAFLIKENIDVNRRNALNIWEVLTSILGSGARKIGICVLLLTQTTNVEDINMSRPLRRNFARIALDAPTIHELIKTEEPDKDRRAQLHNALNTIEYPAVAVIGNQVELLDRTGLREQSQQPIDARPNIWTPSFVRSDTLQNAQNGTLRTNERTAPDDIIVKLRELRAQGITRDQARRDYGLSFTDGDW